MVARRSGTSLCEVLLALVLIAISASWALQAAAATEQALGVSRQHADAMQRAELALADLQAMPCDSTATTRSFAEPRWRVQAIRTSHASHRINTVTLHARRGDTLSVTRQLWCSR